MPVDSSAGAPTDLVELGRVVSAYGVKGWIKIQPHSSQAEVLLQSKGWWLKAPVPIKGTGAFVDPNNARPAQVLAARRHGATVVAHLDLTPDRDAAETFKGYTVWVSRAQFPSPDNDEYYWVDLIGCQLIGLQEGEPALIGLVSEVIDNGAHAVLKVARALIDEHGAVSLMQNQKGHTIDVLVPFVKAHVHTVDLANKRLESDWPVEF